MYDPMTVAFEIRSPIKRKSKLFPEGYREPVIVIWHVDPEKDGSDDSCDWFGWKRPLNAKEKAIVDAIWDMETILDNRPFYPDHPAHLRFQVLKEAISEWRKRGRRLHPRWHFWHWKIQVCPLQDLKRWLWSRCTRCGGRFRWGYAPISSQWDSDGPRWFRGEKGVYHHECHAPVVRP